MRGKTLWLGLGALCLVPIAAIVVVGISDASRAPASASARPSAQVRTQDEPPPAAEPPRTGLVAEAERIARTDPKRSRELLRRALAKSPNDDSIMQRLAQKQLNDENHREARDLLRRCLEQNPKNRECQRLRTHVLEPQKVHDDTTPFLKNCLDRDPKSEPCLAAKVVEAVRNGDREAAENATDSLRAAHPESPLTFLSEGRMSSLAGDYGRARLLFQKACEAGQPYGCFRAESLQKEGW